MSNTNPLGANQVLKKVYNEVLDALDVSVISAALPAGAATAAKQDEQTTLLTDIENNTDGIEGQLGTLITQTDGVEASLASIDSKASTLISQTDGLEASLASLDGKTNNNYGAATGAIRTASQIGNTTGAADFAAGNTSAQTLRTVISSDQIAVPARGDRGTLTDRSGSATTTTSQVAASNSTRKYFLFHNASGAINMWINFGSAAVVNGAGSIQVGTKETIEWKDNFIPTEALNVIAGSGTPTFTAKEG